MNSIPNETFRKVLLELFTEAYSGQIKDYTWFIDNAPKSGLLGTLEDISSEEASRTFTENGSSIAAHTEHVRWSLALSNAYMRGEQPKSPWSESWLVKTVNDDDWNTLRSNLQSEYETLRAGIEKQQDFSDEQILMGAFGFVAHAAYHLGSIRQMKKLLNKRSA
ncbi:MAG: hypothetical protein ACRCYY_20600 [Trueperaceae bacterium]